MQLALSLVDAARRAGVGRTSIYEAAKKGELPLRKMGRKTLVLAADLDAWVNQLPAAQIGTNKSNGV